MGDKIKYWQLIIKTGILRKKKHLISASSSWDESKILTIIAEIHPEWKNVMLKELKKPPTGTVEV